MAKYIVLGAQWGDEGKGKIVDMLAGKMDLVVRFQGGIEILALKTPAASATRPTKRAEHRLEEI